jgi:hypothetical protein
MSFVLGTYVVSGKQNLKKKFDNIFAKVEKTLKGSLNLIPSPSLKIQRMGSNVLPLHLKHTFPLIF